MKDLPFHFLDLQDLVCKGLYLDYKVLLLKIHHPVAIHPLNHLVGAMEMVDLLVLTEILHLPVVVVAHPADLMDLLVLAEILPLLPHHPVGVEADLLVPHHLVAMFPNFLHKEEQLLTLELLHKS